MPMSLGCSGLRCCAATFGVRCPIMATYDKATGHKFFLDNLMLDVICIIYKT
jgi:hypothetical protein